jgi:hypothetical protein
VFYTEQGSWKQKEFPAALNASSGVAVDVNGDGASDLLVMYDQQLAVSLLVNANKSSGSLLPSNSQSSLEKLQGIAVGDMNSDSAVDVVVASYVPCLMRVRSRIE